MKKKLISVLLCATMISTMLVGCGNDKESKTTGKNGTTQESKEESKLTEQDKSTEATEPTGEGKVYYLNFKPEVDPIWQEIAELYTTETGVEVKVVTAASNTYEDVLRVEITGKNAPTLFQINGPIGYEFWKDYCLDLTDSEIYKQLADKGIAITGADGNVYGVPYTVESYGIIYNDAIMQAYFATTDAKASSVDEINTFDKLKEVVEDMTAKKDELEIKGVFASTSLLPGEDWRWQTHLANLPVYYEYKDNNVGDMAEIDFTYSDNFKSIFDLYINNSTCAPGLLGSKSVTDSMAEFALGQCAMVQNGNWAWGQISDVDGNVVEEENIKFMPIYTGVEGEENQGLCTGTENFWCINNQASEADQKATLDFTNWLISSEVGKDYMVNELGNAAPFVTFNEQEKPSEIGRAHV